MSRAEHAVQRERARYEERAFIFAMPDAFVDAHACHARLTAPYMAPFSPDD